MKLTILFFALLGLYANEYEHYKPSDTAKVFFEKCDLVLDKYYYLNCYDYTKKSSKVITYKITKNMLLDNSLRKRPHFIIDKQIPKQHRTTIKDYAYSDYEAGHILSNRSMNATINSQRSTFLMSNVAPQTHDFNRKIWFKAEKRERQIALSKGWAEVINILEFNNTNKQYLNNKIEIPSSFVKIILSDNFKECFKIPNITSYASYKLKKYKINCNEYDLTNKFK